MPYVGLTYEIKKMKAAILFQQKSPLVVAEVDIPELAVGQVLVKVECSGICGKQIDEINGTRGDDPYLPHLLGHEGAGTIVDVGPGVRKVKSGDRVVLHWMKGAGIDSATPSFNLDGLTVNAGYVTTFSDYTVVSENRLTVIPNDMPFEAASLLGCAATTGLGIVFNNADLKPGQSIAVFGVGGVGLNVIQGSALVNGYPIVAIDRFDHKLETGAQFGATHTINASQDDPENYLKELSGVKGFDVVVDTTGNTQVFEMAYRVTSNTGTIVLAGLLNHKSPITIDAYPLHFGRRIEASHGGETKPDVDIPRYIQLYQLGKLKLTEQITHRYPLDKINEAVDLVQGGKAGRCLIEMHG